MVGEMLAHLPALYPNETVYSMLCRYRVKRNLRAHEFEKRLWKTTRGSCDPNFPVALLKLEKSVEGRWFNAERAIEHHTILPYYRGFFANDRFEKIMTSALNEYSGISRMVGFASRVAVPFVKACPMCARQDKVPYLHRAHQVMGNVACHIHGTELVTVEVPGRPNLSFKPLVEYKGLRTQKPTPAHPVWVTLAQDIEDSLELFNGSRVVTSRALFYFFHSKGVLKGTWPEKVRSYVRPALPDSEKFAVPFRGEIMPHPTVLLLLLRACGIAPQELSDYVASINDKRWACVNRRCQCYQQKVMAIVTAVGKGSAGEGGIAQSVIIRCPACGWTMVKRWDRENKEVKHISILDYGPAFNETFRRLWSDRKISEVKIRKMLDLPISTFHMLHAAFLNGLPLQRNPNRRRSKWVDKYLSIHQHHYGSFRRARRQLGLPVEPVSEGKTAN